MAENLFHEFGQLGVEILIADMPTYNGKDRKDVMIRQIREAIAEENRKEIERLWKGRQARVRKGNFPGGNLPYGYRRNGKRLVTDPEESEMVKLIFELSGRGERKSAIARALGQQGFRRRNGKLWTRRQVSAVLTRAPLYQHGIIRYGEVEAKRPDLALFRPVTGTLCETPLRAP